MNFYASVNLGDELPDWLMDLLTAALPVSYESLIDSRKLETKLRNAYTDAMGFYRWINKVTPEFIQNTLHQQMHHDPPGRWLSLIHPPSLPEGIDFMNRKRREWLNPCDDRDLSNLSVYQLYEEVLPEASAAIATVRDVLLGQRAPEDLENMIGNHNLSDDYEHFCKRKYNDPLPLSGVLDRMYRLYTKP